LDREELDRVYLEFTALADRKKGIMDEEIVAIVVGLRNTAASSVAGD
jgi:hypothetical protein